MLVTCDETYPMDLMVVNSRSKLNIGLLGDSGRVWISAAAGAGFSANMNPETPTRGTQGREFRLREWLPAFSFSFEYRFNVTSSASRLHTNEGVGVSRVEARGD